VLLPSGCVVLRLEVVERAEEPQRHRLQAFCGETGGFLLAGCGWLIIFNTTTPSSLLRPF
jgi:hypothetical protein